MKTPKDYFNLSQRFLKESHNVATPADKQRFLKQVETLRQGAVACLAQLQDPEQRTQCIEDNIVYDLFVHLIDEHYTTLRASIDDAVETLRLHGNADHFMDVILPHAIYWFLHRQTLLETRELIDLTITLFPKSEHNEEYLYWWTLIRIARQEAPDIIRTTLRERQDPWVSTILAYLDGAPEYHSPYYDDIQRFLPETDVTAFMP